MTEHPADFDRFDHDDAWRIGSALVARCRSDNLLVTSSIWLGQQKVFHAALPGTSADNDDWVEKKARVVRRFGGPHWRCTSTTSRTTPTSLRSSACPEPSRLPARERFRSAYAVHLSG